MLPAQLAKIYQCSLLIHQFSEKLGMPWKMFAAPSGQCLKASAFIETNFSVNFSDLINVKASSKENQYCDKKGPSDLLGLLGPYLYFRVTIFSLLASFT